MSISPSSCEESFISVKVWSARIDVFMYFSFLCRKAEKPIYFCLNNGELWLILIWSKSSLGNIALKLSSGRTGFLCLESMGCLLGARFASAFLQHTWILPVLQNGPMTLNWIHDLFYFFFQLPFSYGRRTFWKISGAWGPIPASPVCPHVSNIRFLSVSVLVRSFASLFLIIPTNPRMNHIVDWDKGLLRTCFK